MPAIPTVRAAAVVGFCCMMCMAVMATELLAAEADIAVDPEAVVLAALAARHDWNVDKSPLDEVAKLVSRRAKLPVTIDHRALDAIGLAIDAPVTLKADRLRLRSALNHLLRQHQLAWTVVDGGISITTPDAEVEMLVTRVYAVEDLATVRTRYTKPENHIDAVMDLVNMNAVPESYGWATISAFGHSMVVRCTWQNHQRVSQFLAGLRRAHKLARQPRQPKVSLSVAGDENADIERILNKKVDIDFAHLSLSQIASLLGERYELPVQVDFRSLESVGVTDQLRSSFNAKGLRLAAALDHLLRPLELAWMVKDEMIVISLPEIIEEHLEVRFYPVLDLVSVDVDELTEDFRSHDYDSLINLITTLVSPNTWPAQTGPGPIDGFDGVLAIPQTREVHQQIADLITAIREVRRRNAANQFDAAPVTAAGGRNSAVRAALSRPVSLEVQEQPLRAVLGLLAKQAGIPIVGDWKNLAGVGIGSRVPITRRIENVRLESALSQILSELALVAKVRDEALLVTTPEIAEEDLVVRLYPIKDLIDAERTDWNRRRFTFPQDEAGHELIDVIESSVYPKSWNQQGGPGSVDLFWPTTALVVAQTDEVHREIERLLAKVRSAESQKPKQPAAKEEAATRNPLRVYRLAIDRNGKPRVRAKQIAKLLRKVISPNSWQADDVELHTVSTALVIRHSEKVHRQIDELLYEIGAQYSHFDWQYQDQGGFGGGFGDGAIDNDDK